MHLGQLLKILKFNPPPKKMGGKTPFLKILFENINKGPYITLETKFHENRMKSKIFQLKDGWMDEDGLINA